MRRLLLLAGAAVAFSAAGADGARMTYPGENGRIAFVRENPRYSDEMAGIFHTDLWSVTAGRGRSSPGATTSRLPSSRTGRPTARASRSR